MQKHFLEGGRRCLRAFASCISQSITMMKAVYRYLCSKYTFYVLCRFFKKSTSVLDMFYCGESPVGNCCLFLVHHTHVGD